MRPWRITCRPIRWSGRNGAGAPHVGFLLSVGRGVMISWLLLFAPLAIGLEHLAPERHLLVFFTSGLAILPLAAWMGRATENLAERMGEGVGGLINATFG